MFEFWKRMSKEASGAFYVSRKADNREEVSDFALTKVKLIRAQGECLGIRSRRRT